jgi:WD40 repeat protein
MARPASGRRPPARRSGHCEAPAGSDRLIHLWDVKQRQILGTLKENQREVKSLAFSPDARLLISVDRDRGVYAWNVARGTLLKRAMAHSDPVNCCAFAPDGQTYVTAGDDGAMAVWDANALRCTRSLPLQSTPIKSLAVGPLVSATCAADGAIRFWDNESLVNLLEIKSDNVRYVCHDVSPDGRRLAAVGQLSSGGWVVHVWCPADP